MDNLKALYETEVKEFKKRWSKITKDYLKQAFDSAMRLEPEVKTLSWLQIGVDWSDGDESAAFVASDNVVVNNDENDIKFYHVAAAAERELQKFPDKLLLDVFGENVTVIYDGKFKTEEYQNW